MPMSMSPETLVKRTSPEVSDSKRMSPETVFASAEPVDRDVDPPRRAVAVGSTSLLGGAAARADS